VIDWWLILAVYWGVSLGLLGGMYCEMDRAAPTWSDTAVMLTVGPFVMAWTCAARYIRSRRR
jgi:hypothetical protein